MRSVDQKKRECKEQAFLAIYLLFGLMMCWNLLICFFFQHLSYSRKLKLLLPNWSLFISGTLLVTLLYLTTLPINKISVREKFLKNSVIAATILLFLWQIISTYSYFFLTGWDAGVVRAMSLAVARGDNEFIRTQWTYFAIYPNNCLIVVLLSLITKAADFLHLQKADYFAQVIFQCALNAWTGYLFFGVLRKLLRSAQLIIMGYALYVFMIGLSPWVSIPYSDSIALFFPVAVLNLYISGETDNYLKTKGFWKVFLIFFLTGIGYAIKPQTAILLIAIVLIEIHSILRIHCFVMHSNNVKTYLKYVIFPATVGLLAAVSISAAARYSLYPDLDKERAFGPTHYLMMGLNEETNGAWLKSDVEMSMSIVSKKVRTEKEIHKANERFHDMYGMRLFEHIIKKTLTNYNDGTFTWGKEGQFFMEPLEDKTVLSGPLKKIFCDPKSLPYRFWCNMLHAIWLVVLFLGFVSLFWRDDRYVVLYLTAVGLMLFELIFEARARYFYHYVPLFILIAIKGIGLLTNTVHRGRK